MNDLRNALLQAGLITKEIAQDAQEAEDQIRRSACLKSDGVKKGLHSIHLKRHRKFGKHCTIIKPAHALIQKIISMPEVKVVHLGRIRFHRGLVDPEAVITLNPRGIRLFVAGNVVLQTILIEPRRSDGDEVSEIIKELQVAAQQNGLPVH